MDPSTAYKIVKAADPTGTVWPHLFRHTLASRLVMHGVGEFQLMEWFDWSRFETAHNYVRRAGSKLLDSIAERTW